MIRKIGVDEFDLIYPIMENSFPDDERRTYGEQKALLDNPRYCIYVPEDSGADDKAVNDNAAPALPVQNMGGFVAVWELDEFMFLEHLAVNPEYRNGGVGAGILKDICRIAEKTGRRICLEVEPPEEELAIRRIGFYRRNGFFLNEYPYEQPAISAGKNPISLYIMTSGDGINSDEFETIKNTLYREVYGL